MPLGELSKYTHTRLTAFCPGLPGWAGTRKVKAIWIILKQETVSGSGIHWAICKSAPSSRQTTTPAPHHSVFTGRMPFLSPNQQRQSTERNWVSKQCDKISRSQVHVMLFIWVQTWFDVGAGDLSVCTKMNTNELSLQQQPQPHVVPTGRKFHADNNWNATFT